MKVALAVSLYVERKLSMGMRFGSQGRVLRAFCRWVGDVPLSKITVRQVQGFLDGSGNITATWLVKYHILRRFYQYWIGRGHTRDSPLPRQTPRIVMNFVPYIYTRQEIRLLLDAIPVSQKECSMDANAFRTLLLLLYGTGMRISEALSLEQTDLDFDSGVITVRETKFYKSRLVPIGTDLLHLLEQYRETQQHQKNDSPGTRFFRTARGQPVKVKIAEASFRKLRRLAGVARCDDSSYQPRLHDFRHTFAVHRLIKWYREGRDVQRLLPQLSTYLGHTKVSATQRYLTMTPELLQEAATRFERYVKEEVADV
jgi:integrase/recombinase XerD